MKLYYRSTVVVGIEQKTGCTQFRFSTYRFHSQFKHCSKAFEWCTVTITFTLHIYTIQYMEYRSHRSHCEKWF